MTGERLATQKKSTKRFFTATPRLSSRRSSKVKAPMVDIALLAERLRKIAASEHVKPAELSYLVSDTFEHCGVPHEDAANGAEVALWAQLHSSDSHGVVHLPLYVRGLLDHTIKARPAFAITQTMPCSIVLDADNGLGLVASRRAIDMAIGMAKQFGLGAVSIRDGAFGAAGYYADRAAEHGLMGIALTNAMQAIAPTGGPEGVWRRSSWRRVSGTRHQSGYCPRQRPWSRVRHPPCAGVRPKTIPEGWALDASGRSTTDPAVAVKGSLLPIGGPKGYALALIVEILCSALSDGEPGFR